MRGLRSGGMTNEASAPGCKRSVKAAFGIAGSVSLALMMGLSGAANSASSRASGQANLSQPSSAMGRGEYGEQSKYADSDADDHYHLSPAAKP